MKLNDLFSKGYFKNLEVTRIAIICLTTLTIGFLFQSIILGYVALRRQNIPYVVEIDSQSGEVLNAKVLDSEYKNNSWIYVNTLDKNLGFFVNLHHP